MHRLNNKYYKTSRTQHRENVKYINEGLVSLTISVTSVRGVEVPTTGI